MEVPGLMVTPKKVIVFNPNTNKRETWSWIQFQKHVAEFTAMFENAGVDLNDLAEGGEDFVEQAEALEERPTYDH